MIVAEPVFGMLVIGVEKPLTVRVGVARIGVGYDVGEFPVDRVFEGALVAADVVGTTVPVGVGDASCTPVGVGVRLIVFPEKIAGSVSFEFGKNRVKKPSL